MQRLRPGAASLCCSWEALSAGVFQLGVLEIHFHKSTSQPLSPTCIQCTSVSLTVRTGFSHCPRKANHILYLVLIWPVVISIK